MQFKKITYRLLVSLIVLIATTTLAYSSSFLSTRPRLIQLTGLRLSHTVKRTRLVFQFSDKFSYHSFALIKPQRLLITVKGASLEGKLRVPSLLKTPIKAIRTNHQYRSIYDNGQKENKLPNLRIVLDLKHAVDVKLFRLTPKGRHGHRLVVDLFTSTRIHSPTRPVIVAPPKKKAHDIIVVIDPGHGGKDPGATGLHGTREKDIVLAVAKRLQRLVNQCPGFRAVLTRNSDYFLGLRRRLLMARRYKADIFIAIHADAYFHSRARGASVYALSRRGATSEAARWLAEKENHAEFMGGASLSDTSVMLRSVLISLQQTATIRSSLQMGQSILSELKRRTILHHNSVEQAAFVVLKAPDIPSLLIELGFLSNSREEIKLRNKHYQENMARAIMRGIQIYFTRFMENYLSRVSNGKS